MAAGPGAGVDRCLGEAIGARGRPPAGRPLAVLMLNSPDEPARGLAAACLRRADVVVFGDGALGRYGWALEGELGSAAPRATSEQSPSRRMVLDTLAPSTR